MKKVLVLLLTVFLTSLTFTANIAAEAVDPNVTVTYNETNKTIEVSSTIDYISKVTDAQNDTAIWLDQWKVWGRESIVEVNSSGDGFSFPVSNALGDSTGTFSFKIIMSEAYKNNYKDFEASVTIPDTSSQDLDPQVVSMSFNETSKAIDVVCSSSDYFSAITLIYLKDDWNTEIGDTFNVTKNVSNNSFSITTVNGIGENNGTYTFRIKAAGYKDYTAQYTISCYEDGGGGNTIPPVTTVAYEESTKLITVSADSSYIEKVNSITLENEIMGEWGCRIDDEDIITVYNGGFTIDATFPISYNGIYKITIYADGYQNNVKDDLSITGFDDPPEIRNYPDDISVSLNENGDLIIYSTDTEFINDLVDIYSPGTNVIEGFSDETFKLGDEDFSKYYFGIHNGEQDEWSSNTPLEKVNNTTAKFAVAKQKNKRPADVYRGQVLNDVEYRLVFGIPGYKGDNSIPGRFTFVNSNTRIPVDHVKVYVAEGFVIISADDEGLDFLDKMYHAQIALLDTWGVIEESIELSENNRETTYDTISAKYDRVYRIDTSAIKDPSAWTGLIDSTGYGQYCYDGRPFGGTTSISVDKFDVQKIGIDGSTVTDTDTDIIGVYTLPDISPVTKKTVKGWKVETKDTNIVRCVGEEIFITADTILYAIYEDEAEPEKVDLDVIIGTIIANTVNKINVATNAFSASLVNDTFISPEEKAQGAAVWVEVDLLKPETDQEKYLQVIRSLDLDKRYDASQFVLAFDINVFKQIGITGDAIKITETDTAIEISLDLSGSQRAMSLALEGKLGLYSIHEGKPQDIIRGVYDKATNKYTVRINKFSAFAFVEASVDPATVIDSSRGSKPSSPDGKGNRSLYKLPKTGVE